MEYGTKYKEILAEIRSLSPATDPILIAVSKKQPYEVIKQAYNEGIRHFGENYIQEAVEKFSKLFSEIPESKEQIKLHHIGPLQSGNIKKVVGFFQYVHGVGSLSALKELKKRAEKERQKIYFFIQLNLTNESQKNGIDPTEFLELKDSIRDINSELCQWEGFMVMGPSSGEAKETERVFESASNLRNSFSPKVKLSMGMSGDYLMATRYGSDYLRVGSLIFGERNI